MTVAENVGFGLRVRKVGASEEARRVAEALDLVQLGHLGTRKPSQLSGGQRQRVAMARAVVTKPQVLLLDEPLSALDKSLRVDMQIELKRIQREVGITTIFVTHDQEEALTLSDRIGILKDGRVIRHGPPREVYNNPGDEFTARFLGEANIFEGKPVGLYLHLSDGTVIRGGKGSALVAVRPESVSVTVAEPSTANRLRATLLQKVFAGATGTCVLDWNGKVLKAFARDLDLVGVPESGPVWVSWPAERTIVLNR
jgi:ABC-type Fe3+/spermidine/putrescine transport system ATPase subunit